MSVLLNRVFTLPIWLGVFVSVSLSLPNLVMARSAFSSGSDLFENFEGEKSNNLVPYVDLGAGLGVHFLPETEEGATSRVLKTAVGVQWFSFISTQIGLWHWSGQNNAATKDTTASDSSEDAPINFDGISAAMEVTLQLPIASEKSALSYGPYIRYGRHCWSGVLSGVIEPWSKEGCSNLHSAGVVFPTSSRLSGDTVWYLEFSHSSLKRLTTRSVQVGAKLAF